MTGAISLIGVMAGAAAAAALRARRHEIGTAMLAGHAAGLAAEVSLLLLTGARP